MISKNHTAEQLRQKVSKCLPDQVTAEGQKLAHQIFSQLDKNNNGFASLAEIDKGLKEIVKIPQITGLHTMMLKAFNIAKVVKQSQSQRQNDYVTKDEFIYMLIYLRVYYEFYIQFSKLDQNDDRKITLDELQKGKGILIKWKVDSSDLNGIFKKIDKQGDGEISFRQFCEWAIHKYFAAQFGVPNIS